MPLSQWWCSQPTTCRSGDRLGRAFRTATDFDTDSMTLVLHTTEALRHLEHGKRSEEFLLYSSPGFKTIYKCTNACSPWDQQRTGDNNVLNGLRLIVGVCLGVCVVDTWEVEGGSRCRWMRDSILERINDKPPVSLNKQATYQMIDKDQRGKRNPIWQWKTRVRSHDVMGVAEMCCRDIVMEL